MKHCSPASAVRPSVTFLGPVTLFGLERNCIGSGGFRFKSSRGMTQLVAGEICSQWNWPPGSGFLNNSEFLPTRRLARNALPLNYRALSASVADMPDCPRCGSSLEETALHAYYYCERVSPFWNNVEEWTACIDPKQLVLVDLGYVVENVDPPYQV